MLDLDQADLSKLEAVLATDKGEMVIRFHADRAPRHVRNFAQLAQDGFYDGLAFHRVIRNFMVQSGCPNTREGVSGVPGTGGPGHQIDAEFSDIEHTRGVLSMARSADPDSAGSQFFIVHADHVDSLDGSYTAFGFVQAGFDVLDSIAAVECDFGPGGERSVPVERVGILGVTVREAEEEAVAAETMVDESGQSGDDAGESAGQAADEVSTEQALESDS